MVAISDRNDAIGAIVLRLLKQRGESKTLCPSEVARDIAGKGGDWRAEMDGVHSAVDALVARGAVSLSWKGEMRPQRDGPYRIALPR